MRLYFPKPPHRGAGGIILILFHWKHSVSCDLSLCGWTILFGRWQIPYVYENRERFCDDVYVVGMYVS